MSLLTHGGRIVPILTGHQQQPLDSTTPRTDVLEDQPRTQTIDQLPLLDQREDTSVMRHNKAMDQKSLEMPCLKERDLFALPTEGDGNCLYYSLSDQLYGNFDHGDAIRQLLADHIANNKKYFMQFVVAEGGERRRPKRATVSAYATRSADVSAPSEEDMERRFEEIVATTRKTGEWGSSEHLQAFCQLFKLDINVYTMDGVQAFRDVHARHDEPRDVIHVAFHDFRHYSSVRPLDGSHNGLFTVTNGLERLQLKRNSEYSKEQVSCATEDEDLDTKHTNLTNGTTLTSATASHNATNNSTSAQDTGLAVDVSPPWDIQSIQEGLGGRYDRDTIVDMLQKCRGDIDRAFAALLGENPDAAPEKKVVPPPSFKSSVQVSRESSPFSTGSKRSAEDSDDSEDPRPAVRRGRPKRRIVSNLTLGVGISFRDDQNEVVSLNLRMKADAEKAQAESSADDSLPEQPETTTNREPRRSGRLFKTRPA